MPTEEQTYRRNIQETLQRIEAQTIKTNGRVSRHERYFLIVGTAVGVLLITSGSELLGFIMSIL